MLSNVLIVAVQQAAPRMIEHTDYVVFKGIPIREKCQEMQLREC